MKPMRQLYVFFLGGYDAEMVEIKKILEEQRIEFFDKNLSWGASLSAYKHDLKNLSPEKVPVFIELRLDRPYPENSIIIDHHGEKAGKDKKTSIEQVANLLGITLNRKQQLISANDRGHIRAMRKICAEDKEIEEIRLMDRKAQGVTDDDERLAEESISHKTERVGDSAVIVDSLTDKTSPVVDRLYNDFKHIFVYTPGGALNYFGEGEVVCRLTEIYEKKKQDNPSVNFWYGGDLPDYGFFGADAPMDRVELKEFIKKIKKSIKSQHIFMFPFRVEPKPQDSGKTPEVKLKDVFDSFKESGWRCKAYKDEFTPAKYSEYFYFHKYVRDTIFGEKKEWNEDALSYYFEREVPDVSIMTIHIKTKKFSKTFRLNVHHIALRLFDTGIAILSIELLNYNYPTLDDVLLINDFGRRIYPQFLPDGGDIDAVKDAFLCDRISFKCGGIDSDESFEFDRFFNSELVVADYITELLGDKFKDKYVPQPVIDDRMFTVCWYGSDCWSNRLKKELDGAELAYESSWDWYKYVFIDGKKAGCACEKTKRDLIKKHTYARWVSDRTFFGITRYSLVCIRGCGDFTYDIVRNHMQRMYYQMVIILLAQRASILKFSSEVETLSRDIRDIVEKNDDNRKNKKKNEKKSFEDIVKEVKKLHAAYIRFVNRLWFTEVTPQEQGIEMYEMAMNIMGLRDQMAEIKSEIRELYEFVDLEYEKKKGEEDRRLNENLGVLQWLALILAVPTIASGILGMNLYEPRDIPKILRVLNEYSGLNFMYLSPLWQRAVIFGITTGTTLFISLVLYCLIRGCIHLRKRK